MNIVITGTSRGIGLELCRQAAGRHKILAVARHPEKVTELTNLKVQTLAVELTDPDAPAKIAAAVKDWGHVDLLINNAGINRPDATMDDFLDTFQVNSVVPFMVTRALLPLLKKSPAAKAVHVSSRMGSIADNSGGGNYSYRASKAALNMINKSLAIDNPWLTTVVMHPGWVKTDMGGQGAPTEPPESARGIWQVIEKLAAKDTGSFFDFKGERLPW